MATVCSLKKIVNCDFEKGLKNQDFQSTLLVWRGGGTKK